jgi:hypothetical protein
MGNEPSRPGGPKPPGMGSMEASAAATPKPAAKKEPVYDSEYANTSGSCCIDEGTAHVLWPLRNAAWRHAHVIPRTFAAARPLSPQ